MKGASQYDSATKTFVEEGAVTCPLVQGERWYRGVTKIVDNDQYTYEMYMKDDKDQEFKAMEIVYKRK